MIFGWMMGSAVAVAFDAVDGPTPSVIPVYRAFPNADKLIVVADAGDGVERAFLLDTGASISVISKDVASALGLAPEEAPGWIIGISGSAPWQQATIHRLSLGPLQIPDVDVAVGVPGIPSRLGAVPLAGILGNNVWSRLVFRLDYVRNELLLARPGELREPKDSTAMNFEGGHVSVPVFLTFPTEDGRTQQLEQLDIDTGASGIVLESDLPKAIADTATEATDPVQGVGGDVISPGANGMRRLLAARATFAGFTLKTDTEVLWLPSGRGTIGTDGLLGHAALEGLELYLDFANRRVALHESVGPAVHHDLHEWYLGQLQHRSSPDDLVEWATTLLVLGRTDEAATLLANAVANAAALPPRAVVLLARIQRSQGAFEASVTTLANLDAAALVDEGEIDAAVVSDILQGDVERALRLALDATDVRPDNALAWLARADAELAQGNASDASSSIFRANSLANEPAGALLRRVTIASMAGDDMAAVALARQLLERSPPDRTAAWVYARALLSIPDNASLRDRLDAYDLRFNDGTRPWDFLALAQRELGDLRSAEGNARRGSRRDCGPVPRGPQRDNCRAWYLASGGTGLEHALRLVDSALEQSPHDGAFHDTRALVLDALGRSDEAAKESGIAASYNPEDSYLLWQVQRRWRAPAPHTDPG